MLVVGADGLRSRWIAAVLEAGQFAGAASFDSFGALLAALPDAMAIAVNLPLGLVPHGFRRCDALVSAFVGSVREGIVQAPPRAVVEASDPAKASALCLELAGARMALPSERLRSRILELDEIIHQSGEGGGVVRRPSHPSVPPSCARPEPRLGSPSNPPPAHGPSDAARGRHGPGVSLGRPLGGLPGAGLGRHGGSVSGSLGVTSSAARAESRHLGRAIRALSSWPPHPGRRRGVLPAGRIIEGSAEASYRLLHGRPLEHPRDTPAGLELRSELVASAGIEILAAQGRAGGVARDELFDAAVLAWSAKRYVHNQARSIPPTEQWQLDGGRVVAIWI